MSRQSMEPLLEERLHRDPAIEREEVRKLTAA
jgi:hypothetical protein